MAGLKEIERRIKSVKNTKKITYAMKLVSAAKLRKAQDAVTRSREYTEAINDLLRELSSEIASSDFQHPLLAKRDEVKHVRLLVVGAGRGLCGGYNTNLNKLVQATIKSIKAENSKAEISAVLIGKKPAEYFRRIKLPYIKSYEELTEDANSWPVDEVCRMIEREYIAQEIDQVQLIYTRFVSAMSQQATVEKILPLDAGIKESADEAGTASGLTLFEPSPEALFSAVIPRILRSKVRQACLDAKASEHMMRMTAMDAATRNASDLIDRMTLTYNKLRQSGITAELLDIIGGAEAIE